jgi:hypothetical protein
MLEGSERFEIIKGLWKKFEHADKRHSDFTIREICNACVKAKDFITQKGLISILLYMSLNGFVIIIFFKNVLIDDKSDFMTKDFFSWVIIMLKDNQNKSHFLAIIKLFRILLLDKSFGNFILETYSENNELVRILEGFEADKDISKTVCFLFIIFCN